MLKLNFYLQIVFAAILVVILLVSLLNLDSGLLFAVLYLQIPLGVSHVLGGILLRVFQKKERKHLSVYLLAVVLNLALIPLNAYMFSSVKEAVIMLLVVALPWILASYYGFISYRLFKNSHG
ncbi:MAG: hypothetical protein AAF519_00155 [Bacteroidota bacterium]